MPLTPGAQLGSYRIVAQLGVGGMGEVHRAHDTRLGRDVAIKVLPDELSSSPERLVRFEREARIVASLNHPNIVTLYSIEEATGVRFLTMELVEGRSVGDMVAPGGLPLPQVLEIALAIADALDAAHRKGVVHRDLKPANVMVTHDGRVKVLDFGLAKLVSDESGKRPSDSMIATSPLSTAGEVFGTVPYMAPEQIFGEALDARADLFSFGVLVFEMLAGHRPFTGKTFWEVSNAIVHDTPPPLRDLRIDTPVALEEIVRRCLEKSPSSRFPGALDVANELRILRRTLERGTSPMPQPVPERLASIAVLPFVNRSASQDDEYFSDGLADELLGLLTKIRGVRVSARASSFHFRGQNVPLAEIGKALNVATLLDGSVRRAGNRVRISVQLVKVGDGSHLWSETYDRTLDDIFAVQDDIARSVVKELRVALLGESANSEASDRARAEVDRATRGRATDPEAHRLFLLARHFMDQLNRESTAKAIQYLQQAVARDPGFALAWTELSVAYEREVGWALVGANEGHTKAREAVDRALALEPALADAHAQVAWIKIFHEWDWAGAERALTRARELAPGSAPVIRLSGVLASVLGKPNDAVALYRQALEQDPLSAAAYHSLGLALHALDDFAAAGEAFRRALELAPSRIATHAHLGLNTLAQGRHEEAFAETSREPENGYRLWAMSIVHAALNHATESDEALQRLIDEHASHWAVQVAEVYATRGEADRAFEWLDRAHAARDVGLAHVKTSPRLRALRDDPRWHALLGRMGLDSV
jgi:serine/threonine protein kinase/Tfp pilus assembly protein PilF